MKISIDLHVVGSVVLSVVVVIESFPAEEHTKINLVMIKRPPFKCWQLKNHA